ncbi:P-loop containing nucleoside triphosphate hydrolase protein [Pilaira anomala]|nr:P-loop containing nucleoside triphosphate hydrolase protein [Pilaira anomala]
MSSVPLLETLPIGTAPIVTLVDQIFSLLEKVSDEAFWNALFGDRALNLLKRYFGSDVVFLGFIVYLIPIITYHLNSYWSWITTYIRERMYVTIQISKEQDGYEPIQQFISIKTSHIKSHRELEGRCFFDDDDENDTLGPSPPPKLRLFPLSDRPHKIKYKGRTLWLTQKKDGGTGKDNGTYYSNDVKELLTMMSSNPCIRITMFGRDMQLLKSFIQEWINDHYEKESGKLTIYKCMPARYEAFEWRQVGSKELRSFGSVILKTGQKEAILKDITTFRRREHWYSIRGIPYRRGYLLYGPPGTGKTSLVQSVASKVKMNVAIISLSGSMDDEKFNVMLQEIPRNSILVMEDIDHCVIKDPNSEKDTSSGKISMSGLLNALDGVVAQEGTMVFMTCNDVNRIQPALLRPGRIDMKMELGYADKSQISKMFLRFMGEDDIIETEEDKEKKPAVVISESFKELCQKFTDLIPDLYVTPAELQNFFIMNLIDHEDSLNVSDGNVPDYSYLLDHVPAFLDSVKRDREQAAEHKSNTNSSSKPAVVPNKSDTTTTTTTTPDTPTVTTTLDDEDTSPMTSQTVTDDEDFVKDLDLVTKK